MNLASPTAFTSTFRRFGRSNGAVNHTSRDPITTDRLRQLAPSVFAGDKHASRSERYTYIPTAVLLERMADAGFRPYAVMQGGSRDHEKRDYTKHLLRFRHDSQLAQVGQNHNEIVMINSHDGTSSYQLSAGVFRLVCANGMMVCDSVIENVKVKHQGDIVANVIDGCIELMEQLPEVTRSIRDMERLTLSDGEARAFANAALVARYGSPEEAPLPSDRLLTPRRQADVGNDLWRTMNRAQENLIRGGLGYVHTNPQSGERSHRRTREINGIDQNTQINRALWTLAEEMRKLKA